MKHTLLKFLPVVSLASFMFFSQITPLQAQTTPDSILETEEVEKTSSSSSQITLDTTEKLKARIEKIVEERRSQIMGALSEIGRTRKGFIGEVQRVTAETITIKTNKGPQILPLSKEVILTKKGKSIAVDNISVGDWAMVIGMIDDDAFTPELIDISSETLRPKTQKVMIGTITELKKTTMKIKHRSQDEEDGLLITKQSEYLDSEGNDVTLKELETEMQVLVVAQEGSNGMELASLKVLSAMGGAR